MQKIETGWKIWPKVFKKENIQFFALLAILLFLPILGNSQPPPPIQKGINIMITVPPGAPPPPPPPPPPGGGGAVTPPVAYSAVAFEGRAYPKALITVLRNGSVLGNTTPDSSGDFSLSSRTVPVGISTFSIFAEDADNRKSVTLSFTISIVEGTTTTVKGIFISPTIDLSKQVVRKGETLDILGYAYPESEVQIFVNSPYPMIKKTAPSKAGKWEYSLDTDPLALGDHTTKAKAMALDGEQSSFSDELLFKMVEICRGADLNFDWSVDIIDFSILLYF